MSVTIHITESAKTEAEALKMAGPKCHAFFGHSDWEFVSVVAHPLLTTISGKVDLWEVDIAARDIEDP